MDDAQHWSRHQDALRRLLPASRLVVTSDFDGTLSQFAVRAGEAVIAPACAAALDALLTCGVTIGLISGRAVADLHTRFPREGIVYYGNHGMEKWTGTRGQLANQAAIWHSIIKAALTELGSEWPDGVWIEDKGATAAVHYRMATDPSVTAEKLLQRLTPICAHYRLRVSAGNGVWEIKPPVAINKGTALNEIVAIQPFQTVLFLGDDSTDLTAMAALRRMRDSGFLRAGLAVGVVHPLGTPPELRECCDLTAHGVDDVARLLGWLAEQMSGGETPPARSDG